MSKDTKISSHFPASNKSSKGGTHKKRVVSVAIEDVQKLCLRGDHHISSPPSDSWAWRKYGQKPIKGSPYPRGYYKCSSSKGCPARKQVERSKVDPHMLLVTYSSDHNHPEYSANNHRNPNPAGNAGTASVSEEESEVDVEDEGEEKVPRKKLKLREEENNFVANGDSNDYNNIGVEPLVADYSGEFDLFSDLESPSCNAAILDRCPVVTDRDRVSADEDMAMILTTMVEEEELIFSDLGELPECAAVFR